MLIENAHTVEIFFISMYHFNPCGNNFSRLMEKRIWHFFKALHRKQVIEKTDFSRGKSLYEETSIRNRNGSG